MSWKTNPTHGVLGGGMRPRDGGPLAGDWGREAEVPDEVVGQDEALVVGVEGRVHRHATLRHFVTDTRPEKI